MLLHQYTSSLLQFFEEMNDYEGPQAVRGLALIDLFFSVPPRKI